MRPTGSAAELEARRRRAAEFFQERKPLRTIAQLLGASLSSVKRWKSAWKSGGVDALAAKPHPPRPTKLSEEQKQELVEWLLAGPTAAGFNTELWTCARVAELVRKRFRVQYHPDHLGRILHDLGFSPQKPRKVAREQDSAAVERWRIKDWPRIKKKRGGVAQPLYSLTKPGFDCNRSIGEHGHRVVKPPYNVPGIGTTD